MSSSTQPGDVVRRLVRVGERQGLDVGSLLRRTGIRPGAARCEDVTLAQVAELTQELWILTGDELFGLGAPVPLGTFRLVLRSAIHVPDLEGALLRLAEASVTLPGVPPLRVSAVGALAEVEIDVSGLDDPDHLAAELLAALVHRLAGWLAGRRVGLRELRLPWPAPPYAADYEAVFGRHPVFGADRLALAFDRDLLRAPVIRNEEDLAGYLGDQPYVWLATRDYGSSVADRVRTILERGLRGRWPGPDDVSAQLNVSTQHLRRLLRAEGTSIGRIKEELLRDAALDGLRRGEESVEELARRLGFSEASAFRRAFRRWTGHPPGTFRAQARRPGTFRA
ncbi:AraC family transcriptional regulator [Nonomuraea sp. FMUSA5-5]|uniref:AraC family transcriptional regulator n=1 Tax=Nonomuraea composti TaxID=2720023 RepID=A0ABX1BAR7_9ACTN|nr:AraC family transcriptional regulator [Nonomuraea sp. FMUSA5-5]